MILVVEDTLSLRKLTRTILEKDGFSVDEADNGENGADGYLTKPFSKALLLSMANRFHLKLSEISERIANLKFIKEVNYHCLK